VVVTVKLVVLEVVDAVVVWVDVVEVIAVKLVELEVVVVGVNIVVVVTVKLVVLEVVDVVEVVTSACKAPIKVATKMNLNII
jgi:hypothetical protein